MTQTLEDRVVRTIVRLVMLRCIWVGVLCCLDFTVALAQRPPVRMPTQPPKVIVTRGVIDIFTTAGARVTLSQKTIGKNRGGKWEKQADSDGKVSFQDLNNGVYAVKVDLKDHEPKDEQNIKVVAGKTITLRLDLVPQYAMLVLDLGDQAGPDVSVDINGLPVSSDRIESGAGKVLVKRVAVTGNETCKILIRKPHHENYELAHPIKPVEENFVRVELRRLTVTLKLEGNAGARIYINGEDRGVLANDGKLVVSGLVPGDYQLRAQLFGFNDFEKGLKLTQEKYEEEIAIRLEPLVERTDITYSFQQSREFPEQPKDWKIENGVLRLIGAGTVLARRNSAVANRFSVFDNLTMVLNVQDWNGKGIGWIVRATDPESYYKAELKPSATSSTASSTSGYQLNLSRCRSGSCVQNETHYLKSLSGLLNKGGFRILMMVSKDEVWHCITTQSDGVERPLGPTLPVPDMSSGGVGLSGLEGGDVTINQLSFIPRLVRTSSCK